MERRTYSIITFGCQMNKLDSRIAAGQLEAAGFAAASDPDSSDLVILNTCSVRARAQDRATSLLSNLTSDKGARRRGRLVGMMGCVAQQLGESLLEPPFNADFVFGTGAIPNLRHVVERLLSGERRILSIQAGEPDYDPSVVRRSNTRSAYVAVSRGCSNFCSFCIVPYVRGPIKYRSAQAIMAEARTLIQMGHIEICLIGQNVNSFGQDELDFTQLLSEVARIPGLNRLRFITTHPKDLQLETVKLMAQRPLVPYISLPLQSGSDLILGSMRRRYSRADYLEKVSWLRELVPDVFISTDIMVGFPGETEADFEDTLEVMRLARFDNVYSFLYSPRPFTKASELPGAVEPVVMRSRIKRLLDLQREIQLRSLLSYEGKTVEVLVDGTSRKDACVPCGRSRQNLVVNLPNDKCAVGELVLARITKAGTHSLIGEVVERISSPE